MATAGARSRAILWHRIHPRERLGGAMDSTGEEGKQLARGLQRSHVRSQLPWLLAVVVLGLGIASLAPLASFVSEGRIAVMDLMSDPAEVVQIPWYVGGVSDLNLFVWAAGCAVYLIAAIGLHRHDRVLTTALVWLGAITLVFTLDDRFLLHEIVYPWILGLPQVGAFAIYAAWLAVVLLFYRRVLLSQPEVILLITGLLGLGVSVLLDLVGWDSTLRRFAEETAKLLGALAWAMFPAAIIVRHLVAGTTPAPVRQ